MLCINLFKNKQKEPLSKAQLKALLNKARASGDKEKAKEYKERLLTLSLKRAEQWMM